MPALQYPYGPKMLRETLCVAQSAVLRAGGERAQEHAARLQDLIDECDRHRPLGPDGKHGNRHTPTCGCDDAPRTGGTGIVVNVYPARDDGAEFAAGFRAAMDRAGLR